MGGGDVTTDGPDVFFELDLGDGVWRRISPEVLEKLPGVIEEELFKLMREAAGALEQRVRAEYTAAMRRRPREQGESLRERIFSAIKSAVSLAEQSEGRAVEVDVFDLDQVNRETSTPEDGRLVRGKSVFELVEEGYGKSKAYGFMPLDYAVNLAELAAEQFHYPAAASQRFVERIRQDFAGKHGEGIMVDVFRPLFHEFPAEAEDGRDDFGTPFEFGIMPHSAWEGWHVLEKIGLGKDDSEQHWVVRLIEQAVKNAAKRVKSLTGA